MNTSPMLIRFAGELRAFAIQMMENAVFIQKELPGLDMPDAIREQIDKLCGDLIGSKHDFIGEAGELAEAVAAGDAPASIALRVRRIQAWIADDIAAIRHNVDAVIEAVGGGHASASVVMLVMESAVNILNATPTFPEIENNEDDENEKDSNNDCFGFHSEDRHPVNQLIRAIHVLISRPGHSLEALGKLRIFLFAMERLPMMTPGVRMALVLRLDFSGESDWMEIRIEDDTFTLGRGSWIEGDAATETVFEVGSNYRDGDAFDASNFAQSFINCAEDSCREVVIDDSADQPFDGWDLKPDKSRWADLPCSFE